MTSITVSQDRDARLFKHGRVTIRGISIVTDPWHLKGDKHTCSEVGVPVFPLRELVSKVYLSDPKSRKTAVRAIAKAVPFNHP